MPTRRQLLLSLAGGAVGACGLARIAGAQEHVRFFRIGTGTTGGTYFPIGGILAGAISGPPGLPDCGAPGGSCGVPGLIAVAQASEGSVDNVLQIGRGMLEAGLAQADVAYAAYTGTNQFAESGAIPELRAIAHLYDEYVHVCAAADGPVRTIPDLFGKRVAIGPEGSGTRFDAERILAAYGLTTADIVALSDTTEVAADRLARDEIDALLMVGGPPVVIIADLARRRPIRFVPIDGEEAEALVATSPFFTRRMIPEAAYPDLEAVPTLAVGALLLVSSAVDADTVYEITRALWEPATGELLRTGHPRGAEIVEDSALDGLAIPLHAGAARWYAERALSRRPPAERAPSPEPAPEPAEPEDAGAPAADG